MKKFFTSLILFLCLINIGFIPKAYAQPGQIGTGTGTSVYLPIYTYYGYNYSQQIYTAAEVSAAIGTATYITAIKFYSNTVVNSQATYNDWVVYMGNTAQNNFATTTSWIPVGSLSEVYTGTIPTLTSGGWVTIQLTNPFIWNGTDNLVIAVNEKTPSYSSSPGTAWGTYSAGANRGILYYEDTTNPNPASPPTAKGRYSDIPRVQLVSETLQPCTSAPPANVAVSNVTPTTANVTWTTAIGSTYVVRYKEVSATTWQEIPVNTPLAGSQIINNLTEQTQYEVQVATICGGTQGAFSPSVTFTTPAISYCSAGSTSSTIDGYISQVAVTATGAPSMVSNSAFSNYTDYSTDPARLVTLVRGSANNTVTITKTWPDYQYGFSTGVWIDFNRNGVFEASERVLTSPSNTTSPVTATFTVPGPPNVYNGPLTTKMRVGLAESSSVSACGTFTWGEVEDYAVKLIDLDACSAAPPANISVNNITPTTANVTWTSATGATYIVRYKAVSATTWQEIPVTTPLASNQIINNLTEQTQYEVQVATVCGGTQGAFSPSVVFTTPAITYCTSTPTSTTPDGYITNVTVTPTNAPIMASNSAFDSYKDYTADATRLVILERGSTGNKISVTKYYPGTTYSFGVVAWIDFNRNGTFETNEKVLDTSSNTTTPVTSPPAGFAVPALPNVYNGTLTTRMRVVMRYNGIPGPCGTISEGEVEDYAVKFIDAQPCTTAPPSNITVTNLTSASATVSWVATTGATYTVRWRVSPSGAWQTFTLPAGQNFYTIPGLAEQTTYDVQVSTKCGTSTGAYSPSVTFTTPPLSYCQMTGTGTNDHISNVTVTSSNLGVPPMNNTSVQTNYISYTTPETLITLDAGSQNNKISVAKGWTGSTSNDAVTAWIDFDRNGQFTDAERILISSASTTTPVTANFSVPGAAYTGPLTTTMRVVLKRTSAPVMCQNAVNGEVEDYRVKIRPCSTATPNQPTITATHNSATLTFTGGTLTYLVRYRVQATPPGAWTEVYASALLNNLPLVLNGLIPATIYEVQVAAVCGDVIGAFTPVKTFVTRCDPTPPNVTISNITPTTALITWAPLAASSTYTMRWRKVGTTGWPNPDIALPAAPTNTYVLGSVTPLEPYTTYEVQIANQCVGETTLNPYSNPKVFTTERICELPPPGLTITQLLPTLAEVKWDPFPGATYLLRYRKVGIPSWTEIQTPVNNVVLSGLTELTKYEMQVVNICNGTTPGTYTPPYYFTTPTVVYCNMGSLSSAGEHISKVTVKPNGKPVMENESGASTYTNYTGVPETFIELIQGSSDNEIIIEKKWTGTSYNEGVAVWIDFNRNGEFDINERVFTSPPNTTSPVSGKFSVPADAFVSMTDYKYVVMRVAMQRDGIPVNCTNFENGEVEDYTVRISKKAVPNPTDQSDILIYPNPVSSVLYVKNISKRAKYKIYNAAGQVIADGILLNNQINVSRLINGVYVIDIEDNDKTVQKKFIKE